ncbi:Probable LRR receptor-like serine/threonine-protein kinase At4g37250 [Linum perenne]
MFLELSNNRLSEGISTVVRNLTEVRLRQNQLYGEIAGGFGSVRVLDVSSNLLNGSLPSDFGGQSLVYFNVSHNQISGAIPADFAARIPSNATVDFSFNNLTGEVPDSTEAVFDFLFASCDCCLFDDYRI